MITQVELMRALYRRRRAAPQRPRARLGRADAPPQEGLTTGTYAAVRGRSGQSCRFEPWTITGLLPVRGAAVLRAPRRARRRARSTPPAGSSTRTRRGLLIRLPSAIVGAAPSRVGQRRRSSVG